MTVIETVNAPGFGPPRHRHPQTEIFRVMEGRYLYEVDGRRFFANARDLVTVRGGAVHGFVNVADRPARQLIMILPGLDAERFFTELGEIMQHGVPDRAWLNEFGRRWNIEFPGAAGKGWRWPNGTMMARLIRQAVACGPDGAIRTMELANMSKYSSRLSLGAAVLALVFTSHVSATEARYECSGGTKLTAQFSPPSAQAGRVTLTFDGGREAILPQAISADGGRYVGGDIEFWIKGRSATLTRDGNSETCETR